MAYDEELAERVRHELAGEPGLTERGMFGGLGFMLDGRMAVAAGSRGVLMVRVDPAEADVLVSEDGVSRCVMRGRELEGWVDVEGAATATVEELARWVGTGVARVRTLPDS